MEAQEERRLATLQQARTKGLAFLAKNAEIKDVMTLPSGLQYQVKKEGTGKPPNFK
ncbi:MAG: FKBP-type peptidyl-prolyl cis-trans isomerase N-terminal domain-containing protein [Deltaproteobacteria bacterium]|nr:FKBP-type peptidyl-prolyl cis-trans isomerase N-terminal domain-containing protein [Deltaproteobacteria bacterium]